MSLTVDIEKRLGDFSLRIAFETDALTTGLLGASGSGKSVTLKCIAGILKPDRGHIELNGRVLFDSAKRINLPPQKRRVGYLFQNYALFPNMTVRQNIACGLHHEKDRGRRERAVSDMIVSMRLTGLEQHKPGQLSGGQQQRAALARILVGNPDLLMLDEPTSALDSFLAEQLRAELSALLQRFQKDALLVTHSRDEAYGLCRSLAVVDGGRIVRMGNTHDVFADPMTRSAAILTGCRNVTDAQKAGDTRVFVPAWGVTLETGRPVNESLCAVGVRAHAFSQSAAENRFPVRILETQEAPFEWTTRFCYASHFVDAPPVQWKLPKGDAPLAVPEALGVQASDILLLYE